MLYVIPFILLLVIAIFLKKREDANKEKNTDKNKKTKSKVANNKNTRSTRTSQTSRTQSKPVEDVLKQKETSPLNNEFKTLIERLIAEKNFSSAEIKINQSLNQDNSQHELYLYLLDIHLAHKDDLAINQLLNHIRSLKLDNIFGQALEKQKQYEEQNKSANLNTINFDSPHTKKVSNQVQSHADFDALVETKKNQNNESLEIQLAEPHASVAVEEKAESSLIEFNFSPTENKPLQDQAINSSITEPNLDLKIKQPEQNTPIEFNFELNPQIKKEVTAQPTESAEISTTTKDLIEFENNSTEFNTITAETVELPVKPIQDLEFKLDSAPTKIPTDLKFDIPTEQLTIEPLPFKVPSNLTLQPQSIDPLVQSFPALIEISEIQLNLELAEQYIALGAYESARLLLSQHEEEYSPEQRLTSQNLLNRIAS